MHILKVGYKFDFKSAQEYLNEADKLSEQGKCKEAIILLDKAIEKEPKYIGANINRGADKSALKDYTLIIKNVEFLV